VPPERSALEAAFRELHGRRLHGFALLLTLGDTDRAAVLAGEALTAGTEHATELRHPERAAAWLRARVTRRAGRVPRPDARSTLTLAGLAVDDATLAGLAVLDTRTRAAVIGRAVEGLDLRDVGTIVERDGRDLSRLVERGIVRYAAARAATATAPPDDEAGPLVDRIRTTARRAVE
jgi:hypothetical protein